MPLTWNIGNIEAYKDNVESAYIEFDNGFGGKSFDLNPKTKSFVFWNSVVAIGVITEKNACDYYARTKVVEQYMNTFFMSKWDGDNVIDVPMSAYDVKDHIGLSTNVSTIGNSKWVDNVMRNQKDTKWPEVKIIKAMLTVKAYEYRLMQQLEKGL